MRFPRACVFVPAVVLAACATAYRPARLSEPAVGRVGTVGTVGTVGSVGSVGSVGLGGGLRVQALRVLLSEDVLEVGLGADAGLVVELEVANGGREPYTLNAVTVSCWMEVDRARPSETLSLVPAGGGEGSFPGGSVADEPALGAVVVPPGQTRSAWVLLRGYHFPRSDVPRRITLAVPDTNGHRVELVLADPARGLQRWEVEPIRRGWMLGFQNTTLFGGHLNGTGLATQIGRVMRVGPLLLDVGLSSRLLVQSHGDLTSPTSSFATTGIAAHLAVPFVSWGSWQEPRALAAYAGGEAMTMVAIESRRAPGDDSPPIFYGAVTAEAGLELAVGTVRPRGTPFPLSADGPGVPRWSVRVGYVQWWVGGGTSGGYTTSLRLAW